VAIEVDPGGVGQGRGCFWKKAGGEENGREVFCEQREGILAEELGAW